MAPAQGPPEFFGGGGGGGGGVDCRPYGSRGGGSGGGGKEEGEKVAYKEGGGGGNGDGDRVGVEDDFPVCFASVALHAATNLLCFPGFCVDEEASEW